MTDAVGSPTPRVCRVLAGPPGCGKSREIRRRIIETKGLHVVAVPIVALAEEYAEAFANTPSDLHVIEVHKDAASGSVTKQLEDAVSKIRSQDLGDVVVLITHESMMTKDLLGFAGAHFWIDESPASVWTGRQPLTSISRVVYEVLFDLHDPQDGWSFLRLKVEAPTWREKESDPLVASIAPLLDAAEHSGDLLANISDWSPEKFDWFGFWSPVQLLRPASVTFAGAAYLDSVGAKIIAKWQPERVSFKVEEIDYRRTGEPQIAIYYFADRECTSETWKSDEGQEDLKAISDYITKVEPKLGYWSASKAAQAILNGRLPGQKTKPLLAGLNELRDRTSCAFLYSRKAKDQHGILIEHLGLTREDIRRAQEDEDIYQFASRGIIRDPAYDGRYSIYLYERLQAERLRDRLSRFFKNVSVVGVPDAGIMGRVVEKKKPGRKPKLHLTPEGKKARKTELQRERRRKEAAAKSDKTP